MGIFKTLVISHKRASNGNYVILLQKSPVSRQPCLVFEVGTIISLEADEAEPVRRNGGFAKILDAYACLGMLDLVTHQEDCETTIQFLIVVTGCVSVGKIQNTEIFCITDVALLSMRNNPGDQELVLSVKRLLSSGGFYFAHQQAGNQAAEQLSFDLTQSTQRAHLTKENQTDNRFFWNRLLYRRFKRFNINTSTWLVKIMCGGLSISTVYLGGLQAKACLISRLSCERAGTRFNVRGANDLGHVANFVETEQVIFLNQIVLSFITIRGSIPLFWEQPGVQVGSHRIKMSRGSEISQSAYDKHMFLLKERYENVTIINLLSSREAELALNQLFNSHHKTSTLVKDNELPLINFDFHAQCSRGHRENLDKLYAHELEKYCEQFGFFHLDKDGQVVKLQEGVLRVNCLDCLDRTNSMQTFVGLKMLQALVKSLNRTDLDKILPRLHDVYEHLWIQNGDQISRIYTGTGALEGKNILKDGTLSVARTIQNNLLDSGKQNAIDLLILGRSLNSEYSYQAASLLPHYFQCASPGLLIEMCDKYLDYCHQEKLKVVIGTWNVNGGRHFDNPVYSRARPISDWLVDYQTSNIVESQAGETANANEQNSSSSSSSTNAPVDIYAIGFQEIVDLNAGNIVASSKVNQRDWLIEIQRTINSQDNRYLLVSSVQLVGVCLFVFVRSQLAPHLKDVCNDMVKTGLGGATGNKGGVAIRFRYKASSFCFICAHFAAGQHQVKERNDDYLEITRRLQFPPGRTINSHDYIFWCGDFNYRLEAIDNEEARRAAANGNFKLLLEHDQLKLSQARNQTFRGYVEAEVKFAPTYKYDMLSNDYDSSEKCRMPAYTDRILFKKRHATHSNELLDEQSMSSMIKFYNRAELLTSDHRPVVAELEVEVLEVDRASRAQVLDCVINDCGPLDSTVLVNVEEQAGKSSIDEEVFSSIVKLFSAEVGAVLVAHRIKSQVMIIFISGKFALKALELNGRELEAVGKLQVSLRTNNWPEEIRLELEGYKDNTTNFATGAKPTVHLEDDADEAANQFDTNLGPEINPDTICASHEVVAEQAKSSPNQQDLEASEPIAAPTGALTFGLLAAVDDIEPVEVAAELASEPQTLGRNLNPPPKPPAPPPKSPSRPPSRPPPPSPSIQAPRSTPSPSQAPPRPPPSPHLSGMGKRE